MTAKANATFEGRSDETTAPLLLAPSTSVIESLPLLEEKAAEGEAEAAPTESAPTDAEGKE